MFKVVKNLRAKKFNVSSFYLVEDDWDDWFEFSTQYGVHWIDEDGDRIRIGSVKIGQFEMDEGQRRANIPAEFERLDTATFFSVGQDDTYYTGLRDIGMLETATLALNDVAADHSIFKTASEERVFQVSLTRSIRESTILGEFRRIVSGAAPLSEYDFRYTGPRQLNKHAEPIELSFNVVPESNPPTNIHVLIGRNGVGKSFLLNAMVRALVSEEDNPSEHGKFIDEDVLGEANIFSNVVSVSFSAFDRFEPLEKSEVTREGMSYSYVGLKKTKSAQKKAKSGSGLKDPPALQREFTLSARKCREPERLPRWQRALSILESDPIFKTASVSELADYEDEEAFDLAAKKKFGPMSSGHKIVLLTITKLVEHVEERSLALLDEPEAHLHPPLLSAFVRALSDLLNNRNGVAIVATHSPVVLQEVPALCTWILHRERTLMTAVRPADETFAENAGILTHRVFQLEVEEAGFYNLIEDAVKATSSGGTYEDVLATFNGQLGTEGRALVRALLAVRKKGIRNVGD